jgi:lipopolysaccharide biosynthesis glycosyltransferase
MSDRAICTIITKSYLAYARTLAKSIASHHPELTLYVLLADRVDGSFDPDLEPFKLIYLEDLSDQDTIKQMCFYYTAFELCCALRGYLHEYMLEKTSAQTWLFLDSDIMVFHSLDSIFEQLQTASILLTPHCTTPVSEDNIFPHEINLVRSGLYNAGFLGLRKTEETKQFITWFKSRLKLYALNDPDRNQFVDQVWLSIVPLYFQNTALCSEPGANLGHWNLFARDLTRNDSGAILTNGKPVLFVHYSGWNIEDWEQVSKYAPMYQEKTPSLWLELAQIYRKCLLENGYYALQELSYAFNYFSDGSLIPLHARRIHYDAFAQGKDYQNSPFSSSNFFTTLLTPEIPEKPSVLRRVMRKLRSLHRSSRAAESTSRMHEV